MALTTFKNDMRITGDLAVAGGLTVDGDVTTNGLTNGAARAVTATADGLTTGLILASDTFVTVASANANHIIMLPAAPASMVGKVIRGWIGATACEMRSFGTDSTINGINTKTTAEAALPATGEFTAKVVAAETWLLTYLTELGAAVTIVPDAV
jgi:cytoskeletal protein CcmA (bactofilin family)